MEALNAVYALRSDLVLFLRNLRTDYVHLRDQNQVITETLQRMSQQSQVTPYMFYGQPSQFNAPPSNVSFNSVNPGVNVGTPVTVTAHSGTCICFILL